jgi:hypothetical protein
MNFQLTFVVVVPLVAVRIFHLYTMPRAGVSAASGLTNDLSSLMEEQSVVSLCTIDQPLHGIDDVTSGRELPRIARVVSEKDNIFGLISKTIYGLDGIRHRTDERQVLQLTLDETLHVVHIIDAPSKLALGSKVDDTNQKRLSSSGTSRFSWQSLVLLSSQVEYSKYGCPA